MIINLTYYHVARDVPYNSPDVAVVIDVLRATTTISWALKNGADSIQVPINAPTGSARPEQKDTQNALALSF